MKITSKELRSKWLNFYKERGHVDCGAVSLIGDGTTGVMPTCPIEMESVGKVPSKPAPKVGHDTVAVLQELGYDQETIDRLLAAGVVTCNN